MKRTAIMALLLCLFFINNLVLGQISNLPYSQSFEESFTTGTRVLFLPHWWANEVSSSSRIYQTTAGAYSGMAALVAEPTSTFTADIRLLLNASALDGANLSFRARSGKNGSGTRASKLLLSFSANGGQSFSNPVEVGGAGAFPNADTEYQLFEFTLPADLLHNPDAVIRWQVARLEEGSGTAARILLDDVVVSPATAQLALLSAEAASSSEIVLTFNLPPEQASAENTGNYNISPAATITAASLHPQNPRQVLLEVSSPLAPGSYVLTITGIRPAGAGEPLPLTSFPFQYTPAPQYRDVVINEIFADPNPKGSLRPQPVVLPTAADAEFVELFNASDAPYNLQDLRLGGGRLPDYQLAPGAYVLLVPAGKQELYNEYGAVAEVQGWKSLGNSGSSLQLTHTASGQLLDSLSYSISWYREEGKAEGGWSLEQINPYSQCSQPLNWRASADPKGASPAAPNSVLDTTPDTEPPQLLQAVAAAPQEVVLIFDEYLSPAALSAASFALDPVVPIAGLQHRGRRLVVQLSEPLHQQSYQINIAEVADCSGNTALLTAPIIYPRPAEAGDLLINEIMYNPAAGAPEWVELHNPTAHYLNLQGWYLGLREGGIKSSAIISRELLLMPPNSYLVLTPSPGGVQEYFPQAPAERLLQLQGFPNLRNSGDTLVLLTPAFKVAETAFFSDALHHSLLSDRIGVSLERIDAAKPALLMANWTSAASPHWGSPGMPNSQSRSLAPATAPLQIEPEVVEPTPDGVDDVAFIRYQLPRSGLSGTLYIFDAGGREVNRLADNQLLGQEGTFNWNGTNSSGERVRNGYYIVLLSVFGSDGYMEQWRKTIVVTSWL
ncbi:lamin tail domain-containing protein [Cesiribacter sp. SM1]|uniref:lamin tail domain-containing protein n=1 Tax=Cesiribacter sp. SM1 TaxID=2861196 RepID=UPI001CD5D61C|nr:lamin tail domain-containing protein [Cesiribacter sp. SM1]